MAVDTDVANPHILIVDDDDGLRQLLVDVFSEDYQVSSAHNGLVALKVLKAYDIDLIISDISMPKLDGIGLLKALKEKYVSPLPVLMLTAHSDQNAHLAALELGANDFITKPFNIEHLRLKVRNLLSRSKTQTSTSVTLGTKTFADSLKQNKTDRFITKYEYILSRHYSDPDFTIASCAQHMLMSERQLQRHVKKAYASTPVAHLKHFRLHKGRELLLRGFSIFHTYQAIGLTSQSHFTRAFKLEFGVTPKQVASVLKGQVKASSKH